jgi:imidazoleglycerol-phosphate dehydratase/histidinol-phosphatase
MLVRNITKQGSKDMFKKLFKLVPQKKTKRNAVVKRATKETSITLELCLDGTGQAEISTGIGFFDHMLEQLARHSGCDLKLHASGDLNVDKHHTIEDCALALGEAFKEALGDKEDTARYGFLLPMDESLAEVALDFSGRPTFVWNVEFKREYIGEMPTEMFSHFFKSFSDASACTLHIKASGENEHHKIEAIFKGVAKSIGMAVKKIDGTGIPSTKGTL